MKPRNDQACSVHILPGKTSPKSDSNANNQKEQNAEDCAEGDTRRGTCGWLAGLIRLCAACNVSNCV